MEISPSSILTATTIAQTDLNYLSQYALLSNKFQKYKTGLLGASNKSEQQKQSINLNIIVALKKRFLS